MTRPIRRLALAAAIASLILSAIAIPVGAGRERVPLPSLAQIRAGNGHLVAITREDGRTWFTPVKARRGEELVVARALATRPGVVAVAVDQRTEVDAWPADGAPDDPYYATHQGDLPQIDVPAAWATTRGANARVAVLDTGALLGHADLAGLRVVGTYNALDGSSNVADGHGHGTHVLGTVAAQANNGTGVAGIAPDAEILVVKVLADSGSGTFSAMANGIEWAIAHGATTISMSLGAAGDPAAFEPFRYATDDAHRAGVTVIASAGNSGDSRMHFPSCYPTVISVASVGASGQRSSFSTMNGCNDLAAPGESIASTHLANGYASMSGTSMAAPHVAGAVALVQGAVPGITPDTVINAFAATARDRGDAGRDDQYGHGVIDVDDALAAAASGTPPPPAPTPRPTPTPAPTPTPTPVPTPGPLPARLTGLSASAATISYDANGYCPAAARATTITAATALASPTVAAASSVTLNYVAPGTSTVVSAPMARGASTTTATYWSTSLTTAASALTRAGSLAYWVTAGGQGGAATARYPATGSRSITVAVCPNPGPTIGAVTADHPSIVTDPLGTGTVPSGARVSATVSAPVSDTDGVASATLTISGAGLASPVTLPMAPTAAGWSAFVDPVARGVAGGTLATSVRAVDALGRATTKAGPPITVVRADTAGSATVTGIAGTPANQVAVAVMADDPDARFTTTTNHVVSVRWTATWTTHTGTVVTTPAQATPATWTGGRGFRATLPTTWLTTAVSNVSITATPVATDPYGGRTAGEPVRGAVTAVGAPTVVSSAASAAAVYTDPLGTGNTAALGIPGIVTFTAWAVDTDAIASLSVVYSAPGLSGTRSLAMTESGGRWTATLDPSSVGITGTGTIGWRVAATDRLGLVGHGAAGAVRVTRADTPGTVEAVRSVVDAYQATWISLVADDPDATYPTASSTTLRVTFAWRATYPSATGATVTRSGTVTATYGGNGGRGWYGKVASAAWLPAARQATFTITPTATDPYGRVTAGAPFTVVVKAYGVP